MTAREVVLFGVPVSEQTTNRARRNQWKEQVAAAAREAIAEEDRFEFEPVSVAILQFCFDYEEGDLDNIAKPILDGLIGPAYSDDGWVTQLTLRRTELARAVVDLDAAPDALAAAIVRAYETKEDFVYIRVMPEVDHRRLPWVT